MAFGINRTDLNNWKWQVNQGKIAFLTHYWHDKRFPHYHTVTKVGCNDYTKLVNWGSRYGLKENWIHKGKYPHFDLIGEKQFNILLAEGLHHHIQRFNLSEMDFSVD